MKMELLRMVVGIIIVVVLLFMPTSAQEDSCWDRIGTCLSSVSSDEIEQCCPVLTGEINDERDCFCGVERVLAENATIADAVSQFLSVCSVNASFNTLCPGIYVASTFIFSLVSDGLLRDCFFKEVFQI